MKNQIPTLLLKELNKSKSNILNLDDNAKQFMIEYDKFYGWNLKGNLKKILKVMKKGISDLPICGLNGCNNKVKINWEYQLTSGCCKGHSTILFNLEHYGVEHNFQVESIKAKVDNTIKNKFGVDNISQLNSIKLKKQQTTISNYGVSNPSQSLEIKSKIKETIKSKFGEYYFFQTDTFKESMKKTLKDKYDVTHNMHISEIFEKQQKSAFKRKEYIWKSGDVSYVQGFEPKILKELEDSGYKFADVITESNRMPVIMYSFEGGNHRYYPDIFIPQENTVIEVKSLYTLDADKEKNQAKFDATRKLGYNLRVEVR